MLFSRKNIIVVVVLLALVLLWSFNILSSKDLLSAFFAGLAIDYYRLYKEKKALEEKMNNKK